MTSPAANDNAPGKYQPWKPICTTCGVEMIRRDAPQCWDCLHADDVAPSPELDSLWTALLDRIGKIRPRLRRDGSRISLPPDHRRW